MMRNVAVRTTEWRSIGIMPLSCWSLFYLKQRRGIFVTIAKALRAIAPSTRAPKLYRHDLKVREREADSCFADQAFPRLQTALATNPNSTCIDCRVNDRGSRARTCAGLGDRMVQQSSARQSAGQSLLFALQYHYSPSLATTAFTKQYVFRHVRL
ncbi:hypothetical protein EJ03DRAFT_29311 [Teratosphaeria nubilosa]|uniref:Uncharacterized protein n=1 Tax=Teratosphaeria nubilosa TaxID=161662 RepID=A0A6G1LER2_9PEZI|nr:hypothetical protein EJ03DRAFT_29311 [Teratosphaeria nubilosa]